MNAVKFTFCLVVNTSLLMATDYEWIGTGANADLNAPGNWEINETPTANVPGPSDVAIFNSASPNVSSTPTASGIDFIVSGFEFSKSADFFTFHINNASLQFTGAGIKGHETNTAIEAINPITVLSLPQVWFSNSNESSMGEASFSITNENFISQNFGNVGQFMFSGSLQTEGHNTIHVINQGTVSAGVGAGDTFDGGQILSDGRGAQFIGGDYMTITAINEGPSAVISCDRDAGQIACGSFIHGNATFLVGDYSKIHLYNTDHATITRGFSIGQIVCDGAGLILASFSAGDHVEMFLSNDTNASIDNHFAGYIGGQIVCVGVVGQAFFTVEDDAEIRLDNSAVINSRQSAGQIIIDADGNAAQLIAGERAKIYVTSEGVDANIQGVRSGGQIISDGNVLGGSSLFQLGNYSELTVVNDDHATISGSGFDAVQVLSNGDGGTSLIDLHDYIKVKVINSNDAVLSAGQNAGQIVCHGEGGNAFFSSGNFLDLFLMNSSQSTISGNLNAGQIICDTLNGPASFVTGNSAAITIKNDGGFIASGLDGGQIVCKSNTLDDVGYDASFTLGDGSVVAITNDGTISNDDVNHFAGQIVFDASEGGATTFNAGHDVKITATNNGSIVNNAAGKVAQMYFSSATINGDPTLSVVNQLADRGSIEGIVFDGMAVANNVHIALENTSLVINTTPLSPFTIASLSGDVDSVVNLNRDLRINTVAGEPTFFAGVISGPNNLIIDGNGVQELSGVNIFDGSTIVNGGYLVLNGSVAHDVLVNSNGLLTGSGTIGGDLTVDGTILPGFNVSTMRVNGNYTQHSGGIYLAEITGGPTPMASVLEVGETATLAGILAVRSSNGTYAIGVPYTILTAAPPITTSFDLVIATNPFLTVTPIYNRDLASVKVILNTNFIVGAETKNQRNVAIQFDNIAVPQGDELVVINNLLDVNPKKLPNALDQVAGEQYAYLVQLNQYSDRRFGRRIFDVLRCDITPCFLERSECEELVTWASFEIGEGVLSTSAIAKGFHQCHLDLSLGAHIPLTASAVFGVAANFEESDLDFDLRSSNTIYNGQGALYATYRDSLFYLFSDLVLGQFRSNFKRKIQFADLSRQTSSHPKMFHSTWYAECGVDFDLCGCLVQPFLAADVSYVGHGKISERGADSLNLRISRQNIWSGNSYLGAHLSSVQDCFEVDVDLAWQHRVGSLGTKLHTRFIDFGDSFAIKGSPYQHDGLIGDVNVIVFLFDFCDFYAEFSGEYWNHWYCYSGSLGISHSW